MARLGILAVFLASFSIIFKSHGTATTLAVRVNYNKTRFVRLYGPVSVCLLVVEDRTVVDNEH